MYVFLQVYIFVLRVYTNKYTKILCMGDSTSYCLFSSSSDPRSWSRVQVSQWLQQSVTRYHLGNTAYTDRFPMNGKGLLLLSKDMFMHRVPVGGGILYEDIQLRLQKVVASQVTDRTVPTTENGT